MFSFLCFFFTTFVSVICHLLGLSLRRALKSNKFRTICCPITTELTDVGNATGKRRRRVLSLAAASAHWVASSSQSQSTSLSLSISTAYACLNVCVGNSSSSRCIRVCVCVRVCVYAVCRLLCSYVNRVQVEAVTALRHAAECTRNLQVAAIFEYLSFIYSY